MRLAQDHLARNSRTSLELTYSDPLSQMMLPSPPGVDTEIYKIISGL